MEIPRCASTNRYPRADVKSSSEFGEARSLTREALKTTAGQVRFGGGCTTSADELVDVTFNEVTTNETQPIKPFVAVYVTGGDDYSNVQAMEH